jgi:diacylglycerol kinase (ATP)
LGYGLGIAYARGTVMSGNDIGPIQRLINATRNSFQGLRYAWVNEPAFRYEMYVLAVALPVAWLLGKSAVERGLMIGSVLLVVVVELINSAIEATVNRIGRERHELSGHAKDMGSAAVFGSIVLAAAVWLALLFG